MQHLALAILFLFIIITPARADKYAYSLNIFAGELTSNHWEEFFNPFSSLDFQGSYLAGISLAKNIGHYQDKLTYEFEGQVVKHYERQHHWELNALATARWEPFPWDNYIDTSLAFGLGPSWATEKPPVEIENEGDTEQLMVYWMIELAFSPPSNNRWALTARIHHRSEAYGLVADEGGSNALVGGVKFRF